MRTSQSASLSKGTSNPSAARAELLATAIEIGTVQGFLPEFVRIRDATRHTGLSRAKIYQGIKEGWVRSVSLRKQGQKFAVRLIHLSSLLDFLRRQLEEQNAPVPAPRV